MGKMIRVTRGMFIIFFVLYFVSFVMLPLVCLTEEIFSTDADHSSCVDQPNQTSHSSQPVKNKLPCPGNHSCCNFITSNTANYFFAYNTKENKISVRLRNVVDKDISKVFSKLLKDDKSIKSYGGHKHAGAFWFNEEDPDIESYIKDIYKELKKEK